jgi:hypothetical protein
MTSKQEAFRILERIRKAFKPLEHVVETRQTTLASDHPRRLDSQHALALEYRAYGAVEEGCPAARAGRWSRLNDLNFIRVILALYYQMKHFFAFRNKLDS